MGVGIDEVNNEVNQIHSEKEEEQRKSEPIPDDTNYSKLKSEVDAFFGAEDMEENIPKVLEDTMAEVVYTVVYTDEKSNRDDAKTLTRSESDEDREKLMINM